MCIKSHLLEEPIFSPPLFIRRPDISEEVRLKIGFLLAYYPRYGLATELSQRYKVSRTFVYNQKNKVKTFFTAKPKPVDENSCLGEKNIKQLLQYRIRGGMSISKCSDFLSKDSFSFSSEGWISETIKSLGNLVGNVLQGWSGELVFASDEIYMVNGQPVLVSVDPISSAILSITVCQELNKELWQSHWSNLSENDIKPIGIVGDEGKSLKSAHAAAYEAVSYQPDTFHAITQRFGKIVSKLERQSLALIQKEYERERVYLNAKSEQNRIKQAKAYQESCDSTQKALTSLSDFKWLYGIINRQLKIVRSDGSIRTKEWAEGEVKTALALMEESLEIDLEQPIKAVRNLLPNLFLYLEKAQEVYLFLQEKIPTQVLPFYLAYWQYQRELNNLKKAKSKNRLTKSKKWLINIIKEYQQENPETFLQEKKLVFTAMQGIVQSSSMVECINSILRPIFNESKGQVSQQTLNLVMYWHNHRVYKRGKRKGKSPMELLTGNKLEIEWKQAIIDLAKKEALSKAA